MKYFINLTIICDYRKVYDLGMNNLGLSNSFSNVIISFVSLLYHSYKNINSTLCTQAAGQE